MTRLTHQSLRKKMRSTELVTDDLLYSFDGPLTQFGSNSRWWCQRFTSKVRPTVHVGYGNVQSLGGFESPFTSAGYIRSSDDGFRNVRDSLSSRSAGIRDRRTNEGTLSPNHWLFCSSCWRFFLARLLDLDAADGCDPAAPSAAGVTDTVSVKVSA
jgi:hypothetical protein